MLSKAGSQAIELVIVEDNSADVRLTIEALKDAKLHNHLTVAKNGAEGLAILRRGGRCGEVRRPDLILLALSLPTMDGREVLAEIKADPGLKRIPVVVFTT